MLIVRSRRGVPIRLTDERWGHLISRHPEMSSQIERVLQTITEPEMIQQGDFGEQLAVRFYTSTPLTSKYLIVAFRELSADDGFILTAYFARRPSSTRTIIWKQ